MILAFYQLKHFSFFNFVFIKWLEIFFWKNFKIAFRQTWIRFIRKILAKSNQKQLFFTYLLQIKNTKISGDIFVKLRKWNCIQSTIFKNRQTFMDYLNYVMHWGSIFLGVFKSTVNLLHTLGKMSMLKDVQKQRQTVTHHKINETVIPDSFLLCLWNITFYLYNDIRFYLLFTLKFRYLKLSQINRELIFKF